MKRIVQVEELYPEHYGCWDVVLGWTLSAIITAALMLLLKSWHAWPFE